MKIAHYHVEACDNAKYLGATEMCSHAIYLEVGSPPASPSPEPEHHEGTNDEASLHGQDDLQHLSLLQQLCEGGFPSSEDHLSGHHQL